MTNGLRKRGPRPRNVDAHPPEEAPPDACADARPGTPPEADDEKVGYKNPPKKHRFEKGRSGNPKGRPKGNKNQDTIARDVLLKPVKLTEGGRTRIVTTLEAALLRLRKDALDGKTAAIDRLLKLTPSIQAATEWEEQQMLKAEEHARQEGVNMILRMMKHIVTPGPDEDFVL